MSNTTKTTIATLKTFIEAVEFVADTDEWIPNARQWHKIRDMIYSLNDDPQPQPQPAPVQYATAWQPPQPGPAVGWDVPQPVRQTTGLSSSIVGGPSVPMLNSTKTPDVDTSNGQYQPAFR